MERLNVDFLATPGHKGLLGPLGTGVLAIRPGCAGELESLRQGGTGTESHDIRQPDALPSKFEAGNLNVPGILGLAAGVDYLADRGPDATCRHGQELIERLLDGLAGIQRVRVLGPPTAVARVPLVSVVVEGYDPQEVALGLDAAYRIQVRSGLHCAPLMHQRLATLAAGGAVRFSLGPFTTAAQIDAALQALAEFAATEVQR